MNLPRLILMCGLPGSGKTTLARQLATDRPAIRLTKDEWHWALGSTPWDRELAVLLERQLIDHAWRLLELGQNVVLDFGLWIREERDELRETARNLGVGVELHVLDAPVDDLWRRIAERNASPLWSGAPMSRADLDGWCEIFEPPTADERALFDPPPG